MFSLQTSFKPLLLKSGGSVKTVSRGDCGVDSKEKRLCPNYIPEFGLRSQVDEKRKKPTSGLFQAVVYKQ
jgi:hypothetical protein